MSYWDNRASQLRTQADANIGTQMGYGKKATDTYLAGATNFDASKNLNDYARGAWGSISQALGAQLRGLAGNTRSGRFDSGFYDQDKGTLFTQATGQLSDAIARGSLEASGQNLQNQEDLGRFGQSAYGQAYDMTDSERQLAEDSAREEAQRRRQRSAGIAGGIGTLLGAGVGSLVPGIGTTIGASAGGAIGGAFGG